jgi:hypothetical protein
MKSLSISKVMCFALAIFLMILPTQANPQAPGKEESKQFLAFATSSIGGNFYILGGGIGSLVRKAYPNININAEVTGGTHSNLILMGTKKAQLGLATNDEAFYAYNGLNKFKGKKFTNIRGILGGHEAQWQLYTLKRTGIKSLADLKGKKISLGSPGSVGNTIGEMVLNAYGLKMKQDWTPEYLGHGQGPDALKDGRVDGVLILSGAPVSAIIDITSTYGSDVVFLSPDKDKMAALLKEHPYWYETKIPANTYKGQDKDVPTFAHTTVLLAEESVNPDAIYAITKTILENPKEMGAIHPSGKEWTPENATRGITNVIPFHPGAERYLREKGLIK